MDARRAARGVRCPFVVLPREYEFECDSAGGLPMNSLPLKLAMSMVGACLSYSTPAAAQVVPTTEKAASVKIINWTEIERSEPYLTIFRWTTKNTETSN